MSTYAKTGASMCKGCGKAIVWGETVDGKRIPLDPRPPVYKILATGRVVRDVTCMVSHFATCPHASQFSAGKKKEPDASPPEEEPIVDLPGTNEGVAKGLSTSGWENL